MKHRVIDFTPRFNHPVFPTIADAPWDAKRWPNFSLEEIDCKGTGRVAVVEDSLDLLQELRTKIGRPFYVVSGYRSPRHNRAVGGAKTSYHMEGIAFDIAMHNHDPYIFFRLAEKLGFDGIGTYPPHRGNFIHIDTRGFKARWGESFR